MNTLSQFFIPSFLAPVQVFRYMHNWKKNKMNRLLSIVSCDPYEALSSQFLGGVLPKSGKDH